MIKKDEFYALLSAADLGVITPLRDGMNTTSMEFVIAQGQTKRSPLVLSEFMGISSNMTEALQINPWNLDVRIFVFPLRVCLTRQPCAGCRGNYAPWAAYVSGGEGNATCQAVQRHHDAHLAYLGHDACQVFAQCRRRPGCCASDTRATHPAYARALLQIIKAPLSARLRRKFAICPFFPSLAPTATDYLQGTLAPIVKTPSMAVPTEDTLTALAALSADPRNLVYIISGRDGAFLEQHLGHIEGLGMSAEHGGFIRTPGSRQWTNFTESMDMSWMSEVLDVFKYYTERTTGSHIEVKRSSITWHYRATDPEWGCVRHFIRCLSMRAEPKSYLSGNSSAGSVRIYSRTT